ncbi:hypothetical protein [Kaarinaea lacus]
MGAFSFAAGTLATLSSAFSARNAVLARTNESKLSVELDDNAHRIFTEFSTGMKMLYLHGSRNPCNILKITNQNLKLLHTNLKSNKSYRKVIANIRNNTVDTNHWAWLPLLFECDISATMLFLPAETGVSPHLTAPTNSIQQQVLKSSNNTTRDQYVRHLYISLLGVAKFDISNRDGTSSILLKNGDVFSDIYDQSPISQISASKGNSLILNVQLSTI